MTSLLTRSIYHFSETFKPDLLQKSICWIQRRLSMNTFVIWLFSDFDPDMNLFSEWIFPSLLSEVSSLLYYSVEWSISECFCLSEPVVTDGFPPTSSRVFMSWHERHVSSSSGCVSSEEHFNMDVGGFNEKLGVFFKVQHTWEWISGL